MLLYFNSKGDLLKFIPENVYQGSNKASRIYFIGPISKSNAINVAFLLPNGKLTKKYFMSPALSGESLGIKDSNEQDYYIWSWDIESNITNYAGNVTMQFYITTPTETITTQSIDFEVLSGVVNIANKPAEGSDYQDIIHYLQQVIQQNNNFYDAYAIRMNAVEELKPQIESNTSRIKDLENFQEGAQRNIATLRDETIPALDKRIDDLEAQAYTPKTGPYNLGSIKHRFILGKGAIIGAVGTTFDSSKDVVDIEGAGYVFVACDVYQPFSITSNLEDFTSLHVYAFLDENRKVLKVSTGGLRPGARVEAPKKGYLVVNVDVNKKYDLLTQVGIGDINVNVQQNLAQVETNIENIQKNSIEIEKNATNIQKNSVEIALIENALSQSNIFKKAIDVENNQEIRQTAEPVLSEKIEVLNDAPSTVTKIQGATEIVDLGAENFDFVNAKISGVKSVGKNLINMSALVGKAIKDNGDGTYTFTKQGNSRYSKDATFELPKNTSFVVSAEILSVKDANGNDLEQGLKNIGVRYIYADESSSTTGLPSRVGLSVADSRTTDENKQVKKLRLYLDAAEVDGYNITFKNLMINIGKTAIPYEPYTESVMSLPEKVELTKFDYIENGKLYKHGKILTLNGSEEWTIDGDEAYYNVPDDYSSLVYLFNTQSIQGYIFTQTYKNGIFIHASTINKNEYPISNLLNTLNQANFRVLYNKYIVDPINFEFNNKYQGYNGGYEIMLLEGVKNDFIGETITPVPTITNDYYIVKKGE